MKESYNMSHMLVMLLGGFLLGLLLMAVIYYDEVRYEGRSLKSGDAYYDGKTGKFKFNGERENPELLK